MAAGNSLCYVPPWARKRNTHESHSSIAGPARSVLLRERKRRAGAECVYVCVHVYKRDGKKKKRARKEQDSNKEEYLCGSNG